MTARRTVVEGVVACLIVWISVQPSPAQHFTLTERNVLTGGFDSLTVAEFLVPRDEWKPYPTIADRSAWDDLPDAVRVAHVAEAESLLGTDWPALPATVFLEYVRDGNRSNFQNLQFSRRERLARLVLGEVFEAEGRFLDDIANGIWAISEETYWGVPAHLDIQSAGYGLPDVDEPTVDLFAAETAGLMAWTLYLLGDRLDLVSPLIRPRIRSELKRRLLDPNLEREDFWWMALEPSVINNWTPWVNSNWLSVVLSVEEDPVRRHAAVYKIMRSVDVFINSYPDDGGCDEGPVYWTRAAGSMFEVLDMLFEATRGRIDIYDEPLIREMGRYIISSHVGGDHFINFADARPTITPPAALVFRYGHRVGDDEMARFGVYFARRQRLGTGYVAGRFGHLGRQLLTLFALDELTGSGSSAPLMRDSWLPDVQVMTARSTAGSTQGLFLAAKGGHNEENHNHNDVGSFMIYLDGRPAVIDLGPGTYTRTTFGEDRYTVWNFQSGYHNLPTVNGRMQPAGADYHADNVEYGLTDDEAALSMELAGAYPSEAGIDSWKRRVSLQRTQGRDPEIRIVDQYDLSKIDGSTSLNLMTHWRVAADETSPVRLSHPEESELGLDLHYDPIEVAVSVEEIEIEDATLSSAWGDRVRRIVLTIRDDALPEGDVTVRFSRR